MFDPVVQAAALERVVHVTGSVGRDDHERRLFGGECADLGDRDGVLRQHFEQEGLELVVGAVDLVDQQNRRNVLFVGDGLEQGSLDQKALVVELVFEVLSGRSGGGTSGLGGAQVQELAGVVDGL